MNKFVPYEKLSKKAKRERDELRRQTWENINPVTRKHDNSKAYNRAKEKRRNDECSAR